MSREERRQYQRMMRTMERAPALPPAARARAERSAARRDRRKHQKASSPGAFTRGWAIRTAIVAFVIGFIAFSLGWPEMPWAMYLGTATALLVVALLVGFRLLQRRVSPPAS